MYFRGITSECVTQRPAVSGSGAGVGRSLLESSMADIKAAAGDLNQLPGLLQLLAAALEHACMAFASNQELVLCLKDLQACFQCPAI